MVFLGIANNLPVMTTQNRWQENTKIYLWQHGFHVEVFESN